MVVSNVKFKEMFEKILKFLKLYHEQYSFKKWSCWHISTAYVHCFHKILLFTFAELNKYKQHVVNTDTHLRGHNTLHKIALL